MASSPGARRWFEHQFARLKAAAKPRDPGEAKRRRELLVLHHVLAAPGLGGREPRDPFDELQPFKRIGGPGVDGRTVAAQEKQLGDLDRLVGGFPVPRTAGIAAPKADCMAVRMALLSIRRPAARWLSRSWAASMMKWAVWSGRAEASGRAVAPAKCELVMDLFLRFRVW
jgi:hypothetical protein